MAARPRTLPAAVAPVLVGTALAATGETFKVLTFLAALVGALFIQVGTNLSNDYSDARRAVRIGFADVGLDQLVSMTAVVNLPSRRVMERLGMTRDPADDFEHPSVPEGTSMRPHVLYRLCRNDWSAGA